MSMETVLSSVDVRVTETSICLRTPDTLHEDCRSIPGGRWYRPWACWVYPKTPTAAARLLDTFGVDADRDGVLAGMASAIVAAREAKQGDPELAIPGLRTKPWRHQVRAFQFAMRLPGAMLALGMGTGKSLVSVALALNRGKHTLILCPLSVVPVWPLEFSQHAAVKVPVLSLDSGTVARKQRLAQEFVRRAQIKNSRAVVVINYDSAWREPFASWALKAGFDTVIFDEIHQAKSPSGRRSKFCERLGKVTRFRVGLTGTPMPHSPLDVFAQCRALDSSVFGTSWTRFRARYAIMGGFGAHQVVSYKNLKELYSIFDSVAFQAGREVIQLPAEKRQVIPVQLGKRAMALLKSLEDDLYAAWDAGEVTAANALVKLLRQAQVTGGFAKTDDGSVVEVDSAKRDALGALLDGLSLHEPVVVFGRFKEDLDTIKAVAEEQGRRYAELSGRHKDLATWQAGKMDVLGVQLQAGGVGINLTRAAYAIYYSLDFSFGNFEQSLCRIHRPGQKRPVTFYFLVAQKSIDVKIIEALGKRKDVVQHVLAGLPEHRMQQGLSLDK